MLSLTRQAVARLGDEDYKRPLTRFIAWGPRANAVGIIRAVRSIARSAGSALQLTHSILILAFATRVTLRLPSLQLAEARLAQNARGAWIHVVIILPRRADQTLRCSAARALYFTTLPTQYPSIPKLYSTVQYQVYQVFFVRYCSR